MRHANKVQDIKMGDRLPPEIQYPTTYLADSECQIIRDC